MFLSIREELFSAVGSNRRGARFESIQEANSVYFAHMYFDLVGMKPFDGGCLGSGVFFPTRRLAAENQGDDPSGHVFVDACELFHLDVDAGLLQDFANNTLLRGLVQLQYSAWWLPVAVVPALDHQHPPVLADDGACDGHGVQRR